MPAAAIVELLIALAPILVPLLEQLLGSFGAGGGAGGLVVPETLGTAVPGTPGTLALARRTPVAASTSPGPAVLGQVLALAQAHVTNLEPSTAPSAEKARMVREGIASDLARLGLSASTPLVNWLAESAVLAVRGQSGIALIAPQPATATLRAGG